jgi:hypothetical protein
MTENRTLEGRNVAAADLQRMDRVDLPGGWRTVADVTVVPNGAPDRHGFVHGAAMAFVTWTEVSPNTGRQYATAYTAYDIVTVLPDLSTQVTVDEYAQTLAVIVRASIDDTFDDLHREMRRCRSWAELGEVVDANCYYEQADKVLGIEMPDDVASLEGWYYELMNAATTRAESIIWPAWPAPTTVLDSVSGRTVGDLLAPTAPTGHRMTVGEMRSALAAYPDDMALLMDTDGWWAYVGEVVGPTFDTELGAWGDSDSGYVLPTIMLGYTFDSRDI